MRECTTIRWCCRYHHRTQRCDRVAALLLARSWELAVNLPIAADVEDNPRALAAVAEARLSDFAGGGPRGRLGFGWACASANTPVVIQEIGGGGTLGKALALHLAAVLPTCTGPMICLDDLYQDPFCERLGVWSI